MPRRAPTLEYVDETINRLESRLFRTVNALVKAKAQRKRITAKPKAKRKAKPKVKPPIGAAMLERLAIK